MQGRENGAMREEEFRKAAADLERGLGDAPEVVRDAAGRSFGDFARQAEDAARAGDDAREESLRREQARFLYDRYKDRYPGLLQIPREVHGFYFFEVDGDNAARGVGASKAVLAAVDAFDKDPSSDEWKRIIDGKKDEIMAEYRINVRPEKDYVPAAIERIADMFAASPELRAIASSFKVKIGPSARPDAKGGGFTELIIYGANDPSVDADGTPAARKNHERLLAAVKAAVADLEPYAQKDGQKRMSNAVTDLISTSQSGGDLRGLLKRVDKARGTRFLDEYFDPATGHAFAAEAPGTKKAAA